MKRIITCFAVLLAPVVAFISCESSSPYLKSETMLENNVEEGQTRRFNPNAQAIVLVAPSVRNQYYKNVFQDIVDFQVEYANKINGRDEVIILVDHQTKKYYKGLVPNYILVSANIADIWVRDFAPVVTNEQIKFNYLPDYLNPGDANYIDNSFEKWYKGVGLQYGGKSNLILDGGNVVDNNKGKVVVTDRVLYDNPHLTMASAKKKLKRLLHASHVAIIKESPGDATGHADGMLMWSDDNTIILHDQPATVKQAILHELRTAFPGVNVVIAPDYYKFDQWQGFTSACNIYVNSLVTNDYIYVPTFNDTHDDEMLNFIRRHTTKTVIEVPAEKVCFMGGSVRCLTWQLDGQFAGDILLN